MTTFSTSMETLTLRNPRLEQEGDEKRLAEQARRRHAGEVLLEPILVPKQHRKAERFSQTEEQRLHGEDRDEKRRELAQTSHDLPKAREAPNVRHGLF